MSDETQRMFDSYVSGLENLYQINLINRKELIRLRDSGTNVSDALKKQVVSEERLRKAIDDVATLYAKVLNDE